MCVFKKKKKTNCYGGFVFDIQRSTFTIMVKEKKKNIVKIPKWPLFNNSNCKPNYENCS